MVKVITPSGMIPLCMTSGRPATEWLKFFNQLTAPAAMQTTVTLTGSPFSYVAAETGNILVVGGTVSKISLIRGGVTIPTGLTAGFIALVKGDTAKITYSAAPTVTWLPT